ncbi:SMP-30/gluconolactonase/LRE family protein [Spirillospora sp. NPDC052269]
MLGGRRADLHEDGGGARDDVGLLDLGDGVLSGRKVFAEAGDGVRFDNIRLDTEGRLWAAALDDGVHCYDPDGTLIGRLRIPERVSNIAFGGPKNNRMFITASSSLYSLVMSVTGAPRL